MRRKLGVLLLGLCSSLAYAGDFVDTRLNFNMTDENVLVKPGETNPSVPGFRIGPPNSLGILFFDNYDTRYTGYENLTHLAIYKSFGSAHWTGEAAYVLRLLQFTDVNLSSIDDGSYVKITYWLDKTHSRKTNISLTAFPLNADRMRLGYSYRISWGGSPIFFKFNPDLPIGSSAFITNTNPAPGAKLQFAFERGYFYFGFKTSLLLDRNPNVNEQVAVYGGLFGWGVDLIPRHLRLEGNTGYFYRGTNPLFFGTTVGSGGATFVSHRVESFGATVQLAGFDGITPTQSADFSLYRNDPFVSAGRYFSRPVYAPGFNWLAQAEFTLLGTRLQDVAKAEATTIQQAYAGDVNLRAQIGHLRLRGDFEARSLSFILINQPSLVPYQELPPDSQTKPELFGAVGADYLFERLGLTLGATLGVERPAQFSAPQLPPTIIGTTGGSLSSAATIVIRNEGDLSILPEGKAPETMVAAKLEAREDFLEWFAAILQVNYQHDPNQTRLTKADDGTSHRTYGQSHQLGFNITLQARY